MTAPILVLPHDAPRADWLEARHTGIGASDIAAVLGISPWQSPFSLYWQKVHRWSSPDDDHKEAGRRMEPVIAEWWEERADPLENLIVRSAGLYRSAERPFQLATPDRLIYLPCPECNGSRYFCACKDGTDGHGAIAVLECKHPFNWDGFGADGTGQIPDQYSAQVQQQCDVMGVGEWFLAAYADHQFRVYHGHVDATDIAVIRARGAEFWARVERGDVPDVDEHPATAEALKRLHPSVEDRDVEVDVQFAEGYRRARAAKARATALVDRYDNRARALLGDARRLTCNRKLVVSRSVWERTGEDYDLHALDEGYPIVDRLNPGRAESYVRSR